MSVLLEDDEPAMLEAALSFLESYGHHEDHHGNGGGFPGSSSVHHEPMGHDVFFFGAMQAANAGAAHGHEHQYHRAQLPPAPASQHHVQQQQHSLALSSPGAPASAASASAPVKRKVKKKQIRKKTSDYNPNRARDERKEELLYLRNKVREMEDQLEDLKTSGSGSVLAKGPRQRPSRVDSTTLPSAPPTLRIEDDIDTPCTSASVWEHLASRQHAERHKAELENIRLKMILEGQIKVAKSLEKILKKRNTIQLFQTSVDGIRSKRFHGIASENDDDTLFEKLLAGVQTSFSEVDAIFEANGLNRTERPFQDAKIRKNGAKGMYLELFANKIMPFKMHATANAVWDLYTHSNKDMPFRLYSPKKYETTEDTIIESFGVELHAKRTTADFRVRQVMRRYVDETRVVIVWRSFIDPVEFSSQPTGGIRFHEQGYIVTRRPSTMSPDFTLMQSCFIMIPEVDERMPEQENKAGELTDFFLDYLARNIGLIHQMIENCLMDETLKSSS